MNELFKKEDIEIINKVLGTDAEVYGNAYSWKLINSENTKPMVITLYKSAEIGIGRQGSLISVQTRHGYYELHDIATYLVFEPDEIIFVHANDEYISSLIVGKQCTCSLYSNIRREILNADFAELDSAVLLSAMQLSITENMLP